MDKPEPLFRIIPLLHTVNSDTHRALAAPWTSDSVIVRADAEHGGKSPGGAICLLSSSP